MANTFVFEYRDSEIMRAVSATPIVPEKRDRTSFGVLPSESELYLEYHGLPQSESDDTGEVYTKKDEPYVQPFLDYIDDGRYLFSRESKKDDVPGYV